MEKVEISFGLGFAEILQLIFITLKLCKVIEWDWVLVLIPLWVGLSFLALSLLIGLVIFLFQVFLD